MPTGHRRILGISQGLNVTLETHIFCNKYGVSYDQCDGVLARVRKIVDVPRDKYIRRVILTVPINSPDGRSLTLVIREGEQHDLRQFVSDFFELYRMPFDSVDGMVAEVNKRMPGQSNFSVKNCPILSLTNFPCDLFPIRSGVDNPCGFARPTTVSDPFPSRSSSTHVNSR